jgi:hypothetical protein
VPLWRLTIRHGPRVRSEEFDDLDHVIAALRLHAADVVRDGPLAPAHGFRDYEPGERVAARLAVSTGGRFARREAGIDVMGDGAIVPYAGAVRRKQLDGRSPDRAIEAVREALL